MLETSKKPTREKIMSDTGDFMCIDSFKPYNSPMK